MSYSAFLQFCIYSRLESDLCALCCVALCLSWYYRTLLHSGFEPFFRLTACGLICTITLLEFIVIHWTLTKLCTVQRTAQNVLVCTASAQCAECSVVGSAQCTAQCSQCTGDCTPQCAVQSAQCSATFSMHCTVDCTRPHTDHSTIPSDHSIHLCHHWHHHHRHHHGHHHRHY